jgi:DNA-binding MarR family transcriptional regulator
MDMNFTCTCMTVRHASQTLTEEYDRVLAPSGLKITQYMILQFILNGDTEKSITMLSQELGTDRSTTGRNLRVLEREGFVSSGVGNDRREHVVRVTEKGRQALTVATPLWRKAQAAVVEGLGQNQLSQLRALLAHVEDVHL